MAALDCGEALYTKLTGTAAIAALVVARVYPLMLPPTVTLPAISYTEVSGPRVTTHDEASGGLAHKRYQVDSWATTYSGAKALSKQVRVALNGFSGAVSHGADSLTLQASLIAEERDDYDAETGIYRVIQDYIIWHGE